MATKLAIGTWAYCFGPYEDNPVSLEESVQKIKDIGFDGVELCGFPPHAHPDDHPTDEDRAKLRDLIQGKGLDIAGIAADFTSTPPATAPPDEYEAVVRKNLKMCPDLGIPKIRVDTVTSPPLPEGMDYDTAWENVSSVWRKCAQIAQDAGVNVVWEFEPGFMFNKPSEVPKMVDAVNHPNFKILYDTCHAQMCAVVGARQAEPKETLPGGILEFTKNLTGMIGHIHLIDSDNTLHGEETSTHRPFGEGVINFDECIPAILEAGYDDEWWSVDLCFWPAAWEVTEAAKRFLDGMREKYGK